MSKYEIVLIDNIEVSLDLSMFSKTEELYFNATDISKSFGKDIREWFKNNETIEYLNAVLKEYKFLIDGNSPHLEFGKLKLEKVFEEKFSINSEKQNKQMENSYV